MSIIARVWPLVAWMFACSWHSWSTLLWGQELSTYWFGLINLSGTPSDFQHYIQEDILKIVQFVLGPFSITTSKYFRGIFCCNLEVPGRNALSLSQEHHGCCCCSLRKARKHQGRVHGDYKSQILRAAFLHRKVSDGIYAVIGLHQLHEALLEELDL